jgi:hypothetical protein
MCALALGRAGGDGLVRRSLARGAQVGLASQQAGGARKRPRRLCQQHAWTDEHPDEGHPYSGGGFSMHTSFGGAEAPEQLLPYLDRRHAISNQAGSVYRSVNAG